MNSDVQDLRMSEIAPLPLTKGRFENTARVAVQLLKQWATVDGNFSDPRHRPMAIGSPEDTVLPRFRTGRPRRIILEIRFDKFHEIIRVWRSMSRLQTIQTVSPREAPDGTKTFGVRNPVERPGTVINGLVPSYSRLEWRNIGDNWISP